MRSVEEFTRLNEVVSREGGILATDGGWDRGRRNVVAWFEDEIRAAKVEALTFAFQKRRPVA